MRVVETIAGRVGLNPSRQFDREEHLQGLKPGLTVRVREPPLRMSEDAATENFSVATFPSELMVSCGGREGGWVSQRSWVRIGTREGDQARDQRVIDRCVTVVQRTVSRDANVQKNPSALFW